MHQLEESLKSFFESDSKVVVIKGDWGVGKTYFWESYISKRISQKDLKQIAYSYISLFGSSSLNDIRKQVFHRAKAITSDENVINAFDAEFGKSSSLLNKVPWFKEGLSQAQRKAPIINWFSKNSQSLPFISKFSEAINSLEYSLVKNYIVCIDDIERKGKGLSVKEIMGLVDELAQRKSCKVVLIFNEKSFDTEEDRKQFEEYREKVVDFEINHNPTCVDNLRCIFSEDYDRYSTIEYVINYLDLKNIRVIKKIKWAIDYLKSFLNDDKEIIVDELIVHIIVLCFFYYIRDSDLTYDLFKEKLSSNSWLSYFSDDKKEISNAEKTYRSLASNINLTSSVFDEYIIFLLENGYVDDSAFKNTISQVEEKIRNDSVREKIGNAWNIYSDSFSDNLEQFKTALINILNEDMSRLSLPDFSSAIDILEEFGVFINEYVDKYVDINSDVLSTIDPNYSHDLSRFRCQLLKDKIIELSKNNQDYNIDDISYKISVKKGWNPEDIDFLCSLSKDDYINWIKGNPDKLVTKLRGGLLTFRNLSGSDQEKYDKIANTVVSAIKDIASENKLNQYRARAIYRVE